MVLPNRKPTRLANYDYSNQNYYFVTICTNNKLKLFGDENELNVLGEIAKNELLNIPNHFEGIRIDKYVIMPDHIHAIIVIGCEGQAERSRPFPTLSTIVGLYKSGVSKRIHEIKPNIKIWQKSFNDRIIRNVKGYLEVFKYINENPIRLEVNKMQRWITEDWKFELTVVEGKARHCRLGMEKGDKFIFSYECPKGMCPKTMTQVYTWCEVIRCGGDFTYRGEKEKYEMNIPCADGCIQFRLKATPINRDENGKAKPNNPRPED